MPRRARSDGRNVVMSFVSQVMLPLLTGCWPTSARSRPALQNRLERVRDNGRTASDSKPTTLTDTEPAPSDEPAVQTPELAALPPEPAPP